MKKVFIAIDTTNLKKAKKIIAQSQTNKIKIGYKFGSIFMNSKKGREFISKLKNKIIFIDQKYHDTVQTMISAVKALKDLKINYFTVHISSGLNALKAVKKVVGSRCKVVGVSTLTSLDNKDLKQIGYNRSVKNLVAHQAKLAKQAGLDPFEVNIVRKIFKKEIITPGVQIGKRNYGQKRSMESKSVNSDWIVIGRSVTRRGSVKKNIQKLIKSL